MAFITNITNATPDSGAFDPDGNPLGINNDGGVSLSGGSLGSDSANSVYPYVQSISDPNLSSLFQSGYYNRYSNSYIDSWTNKEVSPTTLTDGLWSIANSQETSDANRTYKTDQTNAGYSVTFTSSKGPENQELPPLPAPSEVDSAACPCPPDIGFIPGDLITEEKDGIAAYLIEVFKNRWFVYSGTACTNDRRGGAQTRHGYWLVRPYGVQELDLDNDKQVVLQKKCISGEAVGVDRYLQNNLLGRNCANVATAVYQGTDFSGVFYGTGTGLTSPCSDTFSVQLYEGTECSISGVGSFYDRAGNVLMPVEPKYYTTENYCCRRSRLGFASAYPDVYAAWVLANSGIMAFNEFGDARDSSAPVFCTGCQSPVVRSIKDETYCADLLETENVWAIVATGGGGVGSGDNIEPYWDSGRCDFIVPIRRQEIHCTGEPSGNDPFSIGRTGTCCIIPSGTFGYDHESLPTHYDSCPTGAVIEIEAYLLSRIYCVKPSLPTVIWPACLAGCGSGSGSCAAIDARGPLYADLSYVCYDDGAGHTGQSWIVQSSEFVGEPTCDWMYSIDFYGGTPPAPSGYPITGIFETGLAC
jgi:hypothetical protein